MMNIFFNLVDFVNKEKLMIDVKIVLFDVEILFK